MNRVQWLMGGMVAVLSVALSLGLGVGVAPASPHDDLHGDGEHAAQDLVGTPITDIERQTRTAAAEIKGKTGESPGGHTRTQTVRNAGLSTAAAADPGVGGRWSSVLAT